MPLFSSTITVLLLPQPPYMENKNILILHPSLISHSPTTYLYLKIMNIQVVEEGQKMEESFFFEPVVNKLLEDKEFKEILMKWGLADTLKIASLRFNQSYHQADQDRFLKDLFSNPNVRYLLPHIKHPTDAVSNIAYDALRVTELTTEMFEKFEKQQLVSKDMIHKTYTEYVEGMEICDKVRECLVMEESQHYTLFDEGERRELLFKLFQLLVLGGALNQYEDMITPYLNWTKSLYKSLVCVRKHPESEEIVIDSKAFSISKIEKDGFEKEYNPQTVLFVVINPSIRVVHVLANKWVKFW